MAQFNVLMNITLELNEIDYGVLVEQFLPLVRDKRRKSTVQLQQSSQKLQECW